MISMFIRAYGPAIAWMGVIFYLSSQSTLPSAEIIWWDFIIKKIAHMVEYGILFYLWQRALRISYPNISHLYPKTFIICLFYAFTDEFHQSLTPGRHPKLMDIGFDTIGMIIIWLRLKKAI